MPFTVNGKQLIQIIGVIISVAMVSSAQLTDLLGAPVAKTIVTISGLINMVLQGITVALTTQTAQVQDVRSMPGVDHIDVNANASPALASLAVDPAETKVGATTPEVRTALIAKATS
jgi:hypothetical protein